jgi:hypothetical protein
MTRQTDTTDTTRRRGRPAEPRLTALDDTLVAIVKRHRHITCRGVFYQAVNVKAVEKTEAACRLVERRLLKLRREGRVPYWCIVDESRTVYGNTRYSGLDGLAEDAAELYRRDYWSGADAAVQVWGEPPRRRARRLPEARRVAVPPGVMRGRGRGRHGRTPDRSLNAGEILGIFPGRSGDEGTKRHRSQW